MPFYWPSVPIQLIINIILNPYFILDVLYRREETWVPLTQITPPSTPEHTQQNSSYENFTPSTQQSSYYENPTPSTQQSSYVDNSQDFNLDYLNMPESGALGIETSGLNTPSSESLCSESLSEFTSGSQSLLAREFESAKESEFQESQEIFPQSPEAYTPVRRSKRKMAFKEF